MSDVQIEGLRILREALRNADIIRLERLPEFHNNLKWLAASIIVGDKYSINNDIYSVKRDFDMSMKGRDDAIWLDLSQI